MNLYATTAANANESSWATYCPGDHPSPPPEYETCLGDLYMDGRQVCTTFLYLYSCYMRRKVKTENDYLHLNRII